MHAQHACNTGPHLNDSEVAGYLLAHSPEGTRHCDEALAEGSTRGAHAWPVGVLFEKDKDLARQGEGAPAPRGEFA